jgi:hypothetical protein
MARVGPPPLCLWWPPNPGLPTPSETAPVRDRESTPTQDSLCYSCSTLRQAAGLPSGAESHVLVALSRSLTGRFWSGYWEAEFGNVVGCVRPLFHSSQARASPRPILRCRCGGFIFLSALPVFPSLLLRDETGHPA